MDIIELAVPFFFGLLILEVAYSLKTRKALYRFNDTYADITCGMMQQLSGLFLKIVFISIYISVYRHLSLESLFGFQLFPKHPIAAFLYASLWVDFLYYWFHRMSHEVGFLWAAHTVHHQSEEYNLAVALRQSSFQTAFNFLFFLPLAFLAIPVEWVLLAFGINLIYQFWFHTEVISKMPHWFEFVFNTPSHHRVHHGQNPEYIDRNHGGVFIFWDRLFGTFEPERAKPVYGVVEPLRSWNPLWANLEYYHYLWKTAGKARRFWDKILIWVKPPGWRPDELGGPQYPKPVNSETFQKFHVNTPRSIQIYVFIHFLIALAATLICLRLGNSGSGSVGTLVVLITATLCTLSTLGSTLNLNPVGIKLEKWRLAVFTILAFAVAILSPSLRPLMGLSLFFIGSGVYFKKISSPFC